jgi:hypothetical protein
MGLTKKEAMQMATATREELLAGISAAVARKPIKLTDKLTVTVRELLRSERKALNFRLWLCNPDGVPILYETADENNVALSTTGKGFHHFASPAVLTTFREEWIAAAMEPAVTVAELQGDNWPESVKDMLYREAQAINGITLEDAAKNS